MLDGYRTNSLLEDSMPAITSSHQDPKQVIKNNTIEILMIYTHVFDNDILTFHYTTPFSNYESL
jgi:hypothetical protein